MLETPFTFIGVKSGVLQTIMRWALNQKNWRALLVRMVLLAMMWLLVAFVFATEFYLSTRNDPIKISWKEAAGSAFRDWFPWILLSPVAVVLAGRFRFERSTWRRSLMIHVVACFLFTIAYQGLLALAYPAPYFLSTGGVVRMGAAPDLPPPDTIGLSVFGAAPDADTPLPPRSKVMVLQKGHRLEIDGDTLPVTAGSNTVTIVRDGQSSSIPPPPKNAVFAFHRTLMADSSWTRFLHLAMTRAQFTVPIYLCIVCICWVINHFQEAGERERRTLELEASLTQANLRALKMQLQPHFLFNTLNSISSLIHENPAAADDMIGSLSQFLRATLEISARNEVALATELKFVDHYLEIQQIRFGSRLKIEREIDATVMDALVPPLILQPLVENAIRHGIESREAGGTVAIRAQQHGDFLRLIISDDGDGFRGVQMLGPGNGIGLSNTKARLQELHGEKHEFKITANHPTGACVTIEIPFRPPPAASKTNHEYSSTHC